MARAWGNEEATGFKGTLTRFKKVYNRIQRESISGFFKQESKNANSNRKL